MGTILYAGPTLEPVLLDEAKAHCRIEADDSESDGLLAGYIFSARRYVEEVTGRALMSQTWDYKIDYCWPKVRVSNWGYVTGIDVPKPPLVSVSSITYVDTAGATQTLASSQYQVVTSQYVGSILPAYNVTWPQVRWQPEAITVRFVAGYGSNPGDVPEPIRQAIRFLVGHYFEHREEVIVGQQSAALARGVDALLAPYRVY